MAELQLYGDGRQDHATNLSSGNVSQLGALTHNSSPDKWQQFSRDPRVHDEAIRQIQLMEMAGQEAQDRPLISLDTPATTIGGSSVHKAPEGIQETFISIENQDGRRLPGNTQDMAHIRGDVQYDGRAQKQGRQEFRQQAKKQTHQNDNQLPRQPRRSQQSASQQNRRKNAALQQQQQPQVHVGPHNVRQTGYQQQRSQYTQTQGQSSGNPALWHHSASSANAAVVLPKTLPTSHGLDPLEDPEDSDSDIGFEAEVLGIRRGHATKAGAKTLRRKSQHHLSQIQQEGPPLIDLGDLDGAEEQTPKSNNEDDGPELLIDI